MYSKALDLRRTPMIDHLKGRERALEPFGLTGHRAELGRLGEPARRRVHPPPAFGVARGQPLHGAPVRAGPDEPKAGRRGDGRRPEASAGSARAASTAHLAYRRRAPPQDHLARGGPAPAALVRLRDRAYRPALAAHRAGEGGRVRGARHRPLAPARPGLPGRRRRVPGGTFHAGCPWRWSSSRAVFVHADPGYDTSTALRSWRDRHRRLWEALRELGWAVEVVGGGVRPEAACSGRRRF